MSVLRRASMGVRTNRRGCVAFGDRGGWAASAVDNHATAVVMITARIGALQAFLMSASAKGADL